MKTKKQNGLALLVAMIVLVVMSMAGIGLMRAVDTGFLISGNLAFRQSATHAADAGIETARSWLLANSGALAADNSGAGYYATSQSGLDLTGNNTTTNSSDDLKWDLTATTKPTCLNGTIAGNTVCYIIHRMCDAAGPLSGATCSTKSGTKGGSGLGSIRQMSTYQPGSWSSVTTFGYYRVTVRVAGPRNNVSYVQAFVVI
jgi:type IV pilus assembly protein PilX